MAFEDCCCPVVGEFVVTSGWDPQRTTVIKGTRVTRPHKGIDLVCSGETPIYAIADGTVRAFAYQEKGAGYHISLFHRGLDNDVGMSKYFHLVEGSTPERLKKRGTEVKKGEFLGYMGNTGRSSGKHLHFEVRTRRNRAIDPAEFIEQTSEYVTSWTEPGNKRRTKRIGRNPDIEQQNELPPEPVQSQQPPEVVSPPSAPTTPQQNINRSNAPKTGIKKPKKRRCGNKNN
jgi:murein DD-endopeptidase MepM/ murein hydrolase activator NlpD